MNNWQDLKMPKPGGEWAAGDTSEDCPVKLQGLSCQNQKGIRYSFI